MVRLIFALVLACLLAAPGRSADPPRPTVTMYTASWCGPCERMKREVLADRAVKAACDVVYVEVGNPFPQGINVVPTFLLPGRKPLEGYKTPAEFLAWVRGP